MIASQLYIGDDTLQSIISPRPTIQPHADLVMAMQGIEAVLEQEDPAMTTQALEEVRLLLSTLVYPSETAVSEIAQRIYDLT